MSNVVVLVSGGIDSATCLAIACEEYEHVIPVHYNYGQQTADFEQEQATELVRHFNDNADATVGPLHIVDYRTVFKNFAGGVASDRDSFVTESGEMEEDDGRSTGYVPMRNLHLIATGAGFADVNGADAVFHGAQMGDDADYPDCRPEFIRAADRAVNYSLADGDHIEVETPLLGKEKHEVIETGDELGVPFELTYSCYQAIEGEPEPCGACPACVERAEAFEEAGIEDPFNTPQAVERQEALDA